MLTIPYRWGDNDRRWGPFIFARDATYRPLAIILKSAGDEGGPTTLRLSAGGSALIIWMPPIIRPSRLWVDTSRHAWSGPGRGYWDIHAREYGFTCVEGHLSVAFGRQTHDSSTEQRWGWFLPWTQWRHVRHSLYGLDGEIFADLPERRPAPGSWEERQRLQDSCPTRAFAFKDFDGEDLIATTTIEEREWLFGTGWFKWLSLFRKPKIRRSLDIRFSDETGRRKGSYKGGTIGTGIDLLPGELHGSAFERYCGGHEMTYLGAALQVSETAQPTSLETDQ